MTASQTVYLLLDLALILGLARAMGALARRFGQPAVIGEILAGVMLGPTLLGEELSRTLFPDDIRSLLGALAAVGVALFMFLVGMELDVGLLRGRGRATLSTSLCSTLLPLALGAALAWPLMPSHHQGEPIGFVLFFAVAMAVTAFPVLARIIADRGLAATKLGTTALACAAIADVMAWALLAVVVAVATGGQLEWRLALLVPYVVLMVTVVRPLLRRASVLGPREPGGPAAGRNFVALVLGGLLLSAACTEWLGMHYVFGAFLFGAVMPRGTQGKLRDGVMDRIEPLCGLLLLPVYFVLSGLKVDLSRLSVSDLGELAAIMAVAIGGKFLGAYAGARMGGLDGRQSAALGALLNTRGLTELVVLGVGLEIGVLDNKLYSLMVVMAVTTTALTGPLLRVILPGQSAGRTDVRGDAGPGPVPLRQDDGATAHVPPRRGRH
ncbi:Glutathione-regulated potassium-efflux system protein KefC [Streptomyces sp. ADI97-07]|uniref:cation:proton antiporter n=1 Tax=Streptomyces sp. ADI97-07 TaxID=1522762 RepID=UPI000F5556D9|nr:cation:proton antiporter [Streptomyces sp. ADI97-07]RPK85472.1 Glutathione-regulated potassium-efflux system protein KefC [Streptomyces sp. ADI97-07]